MIDQWREGKIYVRGRRVEGRADGTTWESFAQRNSTTMNPNTDSGEIYGSFYGYWINNSEGRYTYAGMWTADNQPVLLGNDSYKTCGATSANSAGYVLGYCMDPLYYVDFTVWKPDGSMFHLKAVKKANANPYGERPYVMTRITEENKFAARERYYDNSHVVVYEVK